MIYETLNGRLVIQGLPGYL